MKIKICIIILSTFGIAGLNQYDIYLSKIPIAEVTIQTNSRVNNNQVYKTINYISKTRSLFKHIYPVLNNYQTSILNNQIIAYEKNINQFYIDEKLATYRQNDTTFYSPKKFFLKDSHNIFSLLDYVANNPFKVIGNKYIVDRDGESWSAMVNLVEEQDSILILSLDMSFNGQHKSNKKYDVFLWGLFLDNCNRLIWINYYNHQIIKCEFQNSLITLNAYLK